MKEDTKLASQGMKQDGLYRVENGEEIRIDTDDTTRPIRVALASHEKLKEIQKNIKQLLGFKPDIHDIGNAIIKSAINNEEEVIETVRGYILQAAQKRDRN